MSFYLNIFYLFIAILCAKMSRVNNALVSIFSCFLFRVFLRLAIRVFGPFKPSKIQFQTSSIELNYFTEIRDEEMMRIFQQAFDEVKTIVSQSTFQNEIERLVILMENSNDNDQIIIQALIEIRSLFKSYLNELEKDENVSFQNEHTTNSSPSKNDANHMDNMANDINFSDQVNLDSLSSDLQETQRLFKKLEDQFTKFFVDQNNQVQKQLILNQE